MPKNKSYLLSLFYFVLTFVVILSTSSPILAQRTTAEGQPGNKVGQLNNNSTSTPGQSKHSTGQVNAEEHRSTVANFVQALFKTASSTEAGIGEQVRVIAREQNNSTATTTEAMEKVQKRNKVKTFLFGSDYKNLGVLRSEMVQTRNRLEKLNKIMEKTASSTELQAQVKNLEQEQTKMENFIKEQESKFSVFGWLIKLFKK